MPEAVLPRVLVVDDEDEMRTLVRRLLTNAGYAVEVFDGGAAAIARLERDPRCEAVVTDKDMPGVDGFQVASRGHEISPSLAVVMMTAHGARLSKAEARDIDAYVAKPFRNPGEIVDAVARARQVRAAKVQGEEARRTLDGLKGR
jgi:DNA-binding NtrC family response regulator